MNAVDDDYNTPLHYAAGMGQIEMVQFLLEHGALRDLRNMVRRHQFRIVSCSSLFGSRRLSAAASCVHRVVVSAMSCQYTCGVSARGVSSGRTKRRPSSWCQWPAIGSTKARAMATTTGESLWRTT